MATQEVPQTTGARRVGRIAGIVALACAALVALDMLLCYLLVPYGGESQAVWYQYYQLGDEPVDTLICGTSYAMQCINPERVDRELGSSSFSLASPQQTPAATLVAIEDAYREHHIKRVILGASIESATSDWTPLRYSLSFVAGEMQGQSLPHTLRTCARVLLDQQYLSGAGSLAALVPWSVWNVGLSPSAIRDNVERRRTMTPVEAQRVRMHQLVTERGYAPVHGWHCKRDEVATYACSAIDSDYELDEHALEGYRQICRYCKAHDIELYLVAPPWLDYLLLRYEREGGYALAIKPFVDAMTEEGAHFLDFALAKPDFYRPLLKNYYNEQHLNRKGARHFSKHLGEAIASIERGEDVSPLFFSHDLEGWRGYQASISRITVSTFTATPVSGAIEFAMQSWAPTGMEVEYQVLRVREDGSFEELRPYSTEETFTYPIEGHGEITLRVNARQVGSARRVERHCVRTILY